MLEAHHYNTYGKDSDSTSSDTSQEGIEVPQGDPNKEHSETAVRGLEGSIQVALSVIKDHKTFLHKQQVLVKQYHHRTARLPRAVTSRASMSVASTSPASNSGQRGAPQADKNRKRKLKKKRAKEKRPRTNQHQDHSTT